MIVSLVVAASANEVIGRDGALPWHLPGDMRRFRALTAGHVAVMGRLTHESIVARLGHPLTGRTSIVVSRTLPGTGAEPAGPRCHPGAGPPFSQATHCSVCLERSAREFAPPPAQRCNVARLVSTACL